MSRFRTYNALVLLPVSGFLLAASAMALYMQPHRGELTRMGGYLENDYGWNAPQERFAEPLFTRASSLRDYDRHYDVVVLGDSFSEDAERGWQNYLAARTGLSIISFNMNLIPLERVIGAASFVKDHPKLLIFQSIERNAIGRLSRCRGAETPAPRPPAFPAQAVRAVDAAVTLEVRDPGAGAFNPVGVSTVINYWRKSLARSVLGLNVTEVHRFPLSAGGLFSARDDRHMLVFARDFDLQAVTGDQLATARCRLLEIQNAIQRDGRTAFLALIFPDKTSVYADYIADAGYTHRSVATDLERTPGLNIAPLTARFENALRRGVVDLYLPNDTHCGFAGYRLAADAVLEAMTRNGWVERRGGLTGATRGASGS